MSDEPKKRSWAWIGWGLIVVLVLYSLSIGPAAWLSTHAHSRTVTATYFAAYAPIFWMWRNERAEPGGYAFLVYVTFWSSLPPSEH
jgi:hypothetical protein